jgi:hypothetical protein
MEIIIFLKSLAQKKKINEIKEEKQDRKSLKLNLI